MHLGGTVKFNIYGRFQIEVLRESDDWVAYRVAPGTGIRVNLAIPQEIRTSTEIATWLDDLYHELARPGQSVTVLAE